MRLRLSYDLSPSTPVPVGLPPVKLSQRRSIAGGDVSNWFVAELCNHCGTHVDAPWHFNQNGKRVTDLPIDFFFFDRPLVLDVPKRASELVGAADLEPHASRLARCDILLLRTGFSRLRDAKRLEYQLKNPGLSVDAAEFVQGRYPGIRAIALDTLSMAANEHLDQGLEAHRILFRDVERPRILIEDINLDFDLARLRRVIVLPIFFAGTDGGPCTVVAEVE